MGDAIRERGRWSGEYPVSSFESSARSKPERDAMVKGVKVIEIESEGERKKKQGKDILRASMEIPTLNPDPLLVEISPGAGQLCCRLLRIVVTKCRAVFIIALVISLHIIHPKSKSAVPADIPIGSVAMHADNLEHLAFTIRFSLQPLFPSYLLSHQLFISTCFDWECLPCSLSSI